MELRRQIKTTRDLLNQAKAKRTLVQKALKDNKAKLAKAKKENEAAKKALVVVQDVAKETQQQLEYKVSELTTLALQGIMEDPYALQLVFETKGVNAQSHILFERGGSSFHPLDASGGGAVDIASLALRMTMWSLCRPRKRNLLVLDEPLKWLKGKDMPVKGAQMLREMSHKLGVQIIMVSHSPELVEGADNIIEIEG